MTISELKKFKSIYILGYGIEGKSVHRFLSKFCPDVTVGIGDQTIDPEYLEKQVEYDLVIKSPGIRMDKVRGTYTTPTNIFFANNQCETVGVTGTKGKSTTVSLLHKVFVNAGKKAELAGNIGLPMLDLLTNGIDQDTIVILELSSYQLEDIAYSPHVSIILNILEELHNHESFEEYVRAKYMIFQQAQLNDYVLFNPALPRIDEFLTSSACHTINFSQYLDSYTFSKNIHINTVQALAACIDLYKIDNSILQKTLDSFQSLPHRQQTVGVVNGILFINDSAANHPGATFHALESHERIATILLGGQDRGFDFAQVVELLKQKNVEHIVLFPNTQEKIIKLIELEQDYKPQIFYSDSMESAVAYAFNHTAKGETCLLSPGAPSYLMFSGFPARGEAFIKAIEEYEKNSTPTT